MTGQEMVTTDTGHEGMDFEAWAEQYRPMQHPNGHAPFGNMMYETLDNDWDYIWAQDPKRVWTLVDYDGWLGIVPGVRFVNRLGYFVTEKPWEDEYAAITIGDEEEEED